LKQRVEQEYVFFPPKPNISTEIVAGRLDEVPADLLMLDQNYKSPLFATEIMLLVPSNGL
jgi:hypothetical protein